MKTYTEEVTIAFSNTKESRGVSCSGQLVLSVKNGNAFSVSDTLEAGSYEVFTQGLIVKFTPSVGVSFTVYGDDL